MARPVALFFMSSVNLSYLPKRRILNVVTWQTGITHSTFRRTYLRQHRTSWARHCPHRNEGEDSCCLWEGRRQDQRAVKTIEHQASLPYHGSGKINKTSKPACPVRCTSLSSSQEVWKHRQTHPVNLWLKVWKHKKPTGRNCIVDIFRHSIQSFGES